MTATLNPPQPAEPTPEVPERHERKRSAITGAIFKRALIDAFKKLIENPVLMVV